MATLGSALLARDVSVEQAREQQWLNDYYDKINKGSIWDSIFGMGGQLLGTALGGPLGGFLLGNLGKYGSKSARGGFDKIGKHSGGKFHRQAMRDTLTDINKQQELFNSSMLMDIGVSALQAFGAAGGPQAIQKEGLGTLMTRGYGPGAKSGWLGTTKRAGGSGIGGGFTGPGGEYVPGWQGMRSPGGQYVDANTGLSAEEGLTAGDVYRRNPYDYNPSKEFWRSESGTARMMAPGLESQPTPVVDTGIATEQISGDALRAWQKPAFWQYQMGGPPVTSPYQLNPQHTAQAGTQYSPWLMGINTLGKGY